RWLVVNTAGVPCRRLAAPPASSRFVREDPVLRAQLLDRVDPILSNQTRLMTALTESYVEERARPSRFREQGTDEFFQLLLTEDTADSLLEARARALGIPLDEPHAVAIFGPATS